LWEAHRQRAHIWITHGTTHGHEEAMTHDLGLMIATILFTFLFMDSAFLWYL
jgi:hypothetical protein